MTMKIICTLYWCKVLHYCKDRDVMNQYSLQDRVWDDFGWDFGCEHLLVFCIDYLARMGWNLISRLQ